MHANRQAVGQTGMAKVVGVFVTMQMRLKSNIKL
jgi:hypothetical protein